MKIWAFAGAAALLHGAAAPLAAQDAGEPGVTAEVPEQSVFDGDYLSIGVGVGYGASYTGSDDYVAFPLPVLAGSLGGVEIAPRPAGVALDFLPDSASGVSLDLGLVAKLNRDRADQIKDVVVRQYGELDTAVEVGPTAGVSVSGLLNPYDSLGLSVDVTWDVAGAHRGMSVAPAISYFTPLSRGVAVSLSVGTKYISDDFADYYYSVPALAADGTAPLPAFQAEGGFESVGANLLLAYDLDGDVTNGGFSLVAIGGYSRLLNDAADTPFTRLRGDADQWLGGVGLAFTF